MSEDLRDKYKHLLADSPAPSTDDLVEANEIIEGSLAHELAKLMADVVSFYFRAHGAHWNVVSPNFTEWHAFFGEVAADVYDSLDPLAENIRKLGHFAPTRFGQFVVMRELDDGVDHSDGLMLARDLLDANGIVINCINEAFHAAEMANEQGTMDFLAGRDDMHKKWSWQLRSHLGMA